MAVEHSVGYGQVRITRKGDSVDVEPHGDALSFDDMRSRRVPVDPQRIHSGMVGDGHVFANLGLSVALTFDWYNQRYAVLVPHTRPERKDHVAKFISGYIPWDHLREPLAVVDEEIAEEFIPLTKDGLPVRGHRNGAQLPSHALDMEYDPDLRFNIHAPGILGLTYRAPGMDALEVRVDGRRLEYDPQIYFHAPTNSAQLLYHFHLEFPQIPGARLATVQSTMDTQRNYRRLDRLACAEDMLVDGSLRSVVQERGAILVKMRGDDITHAVFEFKDGTPQRTGDDITLYEAFCPKDHNVIAERNIHLHEYLSLPR